MQFRLVARQMNRNNLQLKICNGLRSSFSSSLSLFFVFHSHSQILEGEHLLRRFLLRIWDHFLFVSADAIFLNRPATRKSFLNLFCLHHLLFFFFLILMNGGTKQAGTYQSGTFNMFIYRSLGSLGRGPRGRCLTVLKRVALVSQCAVRGHTLAAGADDGADSRSQGFKEQHGGWRCVAAHRILICSEEWGSKSGSFSSSRAETGLFPRGLL